MLRLEKIVDNIAKIPETPGVYIFRSREKKPIYVGKAINLRKRLISYFTKRNRNYNIFNVSVYLDLKPTESETEALLLEADLIKHFRPKFNMLLKDDRSFLYLVIRDHEFPYVEVTREKKLNLRAKDKIFGPFVEGNLLKEALKVLRKIFPYRDSKPNVFLKARKERKPCLYYYLGKCSGPCIDKISAQEYKKLIKDFLLFLKKGSFGVTKKWRKEMEQAAKNKEFEKAAVYRDKIRLINKLKKFSFIKETALQAEKNIRIEIYDIAQIFGENRSGGMIVYEGELSSDNEISGRLEKNNFRRFKLKKGKNDLSLLEEMISRRVKHSEWKMPNLILVDGGPNQVRVAQEVLKKFKIELPVVGITKNKSHKPIKPTLPFDRFKWPYLADLVEKNWLLFTKLDEKAHQFSQNYFEILRRKKLKA